MTDDSAVLVQRIADGIESIELTIRDLRDLQSLSQEEYRSEDNRRTREAVERKFETLIAATLDVSKAILKLESRSIPNQRKAVVRELESLDVVDGNLADRLTEAVAFRDVLAHSYGPIINDDIVYDAMQHSLDRYVDFVAAVNEYLSHKLE